MDRAEASLPYAPVRNSHSTGVASPYTELVVDECVFGVFDENTLPEGWLYNDGAFVMDEAMLINERKMSVSERAAFRGAKMKELKSFFEN